MGETNLPWSEVDVGRGTFSILERIDVGETPARRAMHVPRAPFSILERIDVGETL